MRTVLLTDHGSDEGSRDVIDAAVRKVTGVAPVVLDAREFMTGGSPRVTRRGGRPESESPSLGAVRPDSVAVPYVRTHLDPAATIRSDA